MKQRKGKAGAVALGYLFSTGALLFCSPCVEAQPKEISPMTPSGGGNEPSGLKSVPPEFLGIWIGTWTYKKGAGEGRCQIQYTICDQRIGEDGTIALLEKTWDCEGQLKNHSDEPRKMSYDAEKKVLTDKGRNYPRSAFTTLHLAPGALSGSAQWSDPPKTYADISTHREKPCP
jgi:hypothetical protein